MRMTKLRRPTTLPKLARLRRDPFRWRQIGGSRRSAPCGRGKSLRCINRGQGNCLDLGEVELAGSMVDIETGDVTSSIEVHHESLDDFARLGARRCAQLNIE